MEGKQFAWNLGKNTKLKTERGVSFEEVYELVQRDAFRRVRNKSAYHRGQKMFIVRIRGRKYAVPYVEYATHIFLKTIYEV